MLIFMTAVVGLGLLAAGRDSRANEANKPDFTGTWELNVNKSRFGSMPKPSRMTLEASRKGDVLHSVQTSYDAQAGGPNAVEGEWYLDGQERPIGTDGKMIGLSRWEANTLVSMRRSADNSMKETIRLTMSGDGKTATEEIVTKSPNGQNKAKLIWERR